MLTHVVLIRLKDRSEATSAYVQSRLLSLGPLAGLLDLVVHVGDRSDDSHYDLVQIATFTNAEALAAYANAPAHRAIQADVHPHIARTAKIDYVGGPR